MLKKILSLVVVCLLTLATSNFQQTFAQTSDVLTAKSKPQVKLTREYLLESFSAESEQATNYNFEKDAFNRQVKKNNLSGTAKTF